MVTKTIFIMKLDTSDIEWLIERLEKELRYYQDNDKKQFQIDMAQTKLDMARRTYWKMQEMYENRIEIIAPNEPLNPRKHVNNSVNSHKRTQRYYVTNSNREEVRSRSKLDLMQEMAHLF